MITDARAPLTIELAVALTSIQAKRIADVHLATMWMERVFTAKVSRRYLAVDAADNVEVVVTETWPRN